MPSWLNLALTLVAAKLWDIETSDTERRNYWPMNIPESNIVLGIFNFDRYPNELSLPCHLLAHFYAARSGHSDFATYHTGFNHKTLMTPAPVEKLKSSRHILKCSKPLQQLPKMSNFSSVPHWAQIKLK